jgi:hypothetical protein
MIDTLWKPIVFPIATCIARMAVPFGVGRKSSCLFAPSYSHTGFATLLFLRRIRLIELKPHSSGTMSTAEEKKTVHVHFQG